jgi:HK97 gp10 family phage protein
MSIKVSGIENVIAKMYLAANSAESAVDEEVRKGAFVVQDTATNSIKGGGKSGKAYKRGKKSHIASAPGEAPAADKGRLDNSIMALKSIDGDGWLVGTALKYGKHLEFGTKDIKPRPWLIPALEANRNAIENNIKSAIKATL